MYVRYKKNIQENDLPRKRVRKASKIAGSGGQYLEIRYPERGRKHISFIINIAHHFNLEIRYPERGRKQYSLLLLQETIHYLEIRYPERGRKPGLFFLSLVPLLFGNKIPREGTETHHENLYIELWRNLEIRYPERGRKHILTCIIKFFS